MVTIPWTFWQFLKHWLSEIFETAFFTGETDFTDLPWKTTLTAKDIKDIHVS